MLPFCMTSSRVFSNSRSAVSTVQPNEDTESKLNSLRQQRDKMKADAITIGGMMFALGELDTLPIDFDEKLWQGTVDHVTVYSDERVVFRFKDGKEIVTRL